MTMLESEQEEQKTWTIDVADKEKESLEPYSYLGKRVKPPSEIKKLETKCSKVASNSNVLKYSRQGQVVQDRQEIEPKTLE